MSHCARPSLILCLLGAICAAGSGCPEAAPLEAVEGPALQHRFAREAFFDAPFPAPDLVTEDGRLSLLRYPNPERVAMVDDVLGLWEQDFPGAGVNAGIFFSFDAAPGTADGVVLTALQSVGPQSPVWLVDIDAASPEQGRRFPVEVALHADGGPFGAPNLLSIIPLQGTPLRADTRYAVAVGQDVLGGEVSLGVERDVVALRQGAEVASMPADVATTLSEAAAAVSEAGFPVDRLAGLTTFVTGDPVAQAQRVTEVLADQHPPTLVEPPTLLETFDTFCVYEGRVRFPIVQAGTPPYHSYGGRWALDDDGAPIVQHEDDSRLFVTVPRRAAPDGGFGVAVFVRTGGGGDRPLIDRGVRAEPGGEAVEPGTGLAVQLAAAGYVGVQVDGVHGGIRNRDGGDEQFLVFNFLNMPATRDNLRQSAVELALLPGLLESVDLDVGDCPDTVAVDDSVSLGGSPRVLFGHSMGATLAPMTAALEPSYEALVLSGAGGSWIENIVFKQSPVAVRPLAELILGYEDGRALHRHDPVLSVVQAAADSAEPLAHLRRLRGEDGPHLLMLQGIVDTYILPPMANATSLGMQLDLAGPPLDLDDERLDAFDPLVSLLPLAGAQQVAYPVSGNVGDKTRVVVQHAEGPIEDGHEVVFQTAPPKLQLQCFLSSLLQTGTPVVVDPAVGCD